LLDEIFLLDFTSLAKVFNRLQTLARLISNETRLLNRAVLV
jgi:hypothetical protein